MSTVKNIVQDLADGSIPLRQAVAMFETRPWPGDRRLTRDEANGGDVALPGPNSFDWVDLHPGLTEGDRSELRAAHDRALSRQMP